MYYRGITKKGIIRPSFSEYSSPVLLVKKPGSDEVRVTIDYRALNAKSKKDALNCPRIDDIIDKLHNADTFSVIDVKAAYHNIPVASEDIHKTAFRFDNKLYEWTRTPFGLSSAPATFNRLMSNILSPMSAYATSYYDDIIVFSQATNHLTHLKAVLQALYEAGLKLNKHKCKFFVSSVNFLGFEIAKNSVKASKSKVEVINNYPIPKTKRDIKKFLGLTGFYRKLINNYACIASPLTNMQCKDVAFEWDKSCQSSFDKLRLALCAEPVLAISNPQWMYILKVDSSKYGVGCILEQENPVTKDRHVIEYGSCKFNKTQQNYPAIELEVCGLIYAVKHWKHYLIGKMFVIETDSKAVQWIKGKRDTLGKLGRWSLYLENFEFKTIHVPGKNHEGPDALSRIYEPHIDSISSIPNSIAQPDFIKMNEWYDEILNDPTLTAIIGDCIELKDNMFVKTGSNNILVVPKSVREDILTYLHSNFGHVGINKMLYRIQERYFWPGIRKDIIKLCKSCHSCARYKDNTAPNSAPLMPIDISLLEPFQKVGMDILGPLPEAEDGSKYVLILQDYFTKWTEAIALKAVNSEVVQNWLINDIIPRYGVFSELVTDQGVQFVSDSFKSFCKTVGIKQKFTTPFHPQTDGMVEKFNRTFLNMIRNYVNDSQNDWHKHISIILFAYRTAINDAIGISPAEALQGRKLKLPIDILRPPNLEFDFNNKSESFDIFLNKFQIKRSVVRETAVKSLAKRRQCYDSTKNRCIRQNFKPNDLVYWKKPIAKKGLSPKLSPIWQGPFLIKNKLSDLNYVICDDKNVNVTVHVNNLKLCNNNNVTAQRIRTRGRPRKL